MFFALSYACTNIETSNVSCCKKHIYLLLMQNMKNTCFLCYYFSRLFLLDFFETDCIRLKYYTWWDWHVVLLWVLIGWHNQIGLFLCRCNAMHLASIKVLIFSKRTQFAFSLQTKFYTMRLVSSYLRDIYTHIRKEKHKSPLSTLIRILVYFSP